MKTLYEAINQVRQNAAIQLNESVDSARALRALKDLDDDGMLDVVVGEVVQYRNLPSDVFVRAIKDVAGKTVQNNMQAVARFFNTSEGNEFKVFKWIFETDIKSPIHNKMGEIAKIFNKEARQFI
jgi:hypothetical protein